MQPFAPRPVSPVGNSSESHDIERQARLFANYDSEEDIFAIERFDLPRGRVIKPDSRKSSPSHGFHSPENVSPNNETDTPKPFNVAGMLSPEKVRQKYLQP